MDSIAALASSLVPYLPNCLYLTFWSGWALRGQLYRNDGRSVSGPKYGANHISVHCFAIDVGAMNVNRVT
jgi:hypothetical protein